MKSYDLRKYPITMKVDCRNLTKAAIQDLSEKLYRYVDFKILGEDVIYIDDEITEFAYDKVWAILESYDVIID